MCKLNSFSSTVVGLVSLFCIENSCSNPLALSSILLLRHFCSIFLADDGADGFYQSPLCRRTLNYPLVFTLEAGMIYGLTRAHAIFTILKRLFSFKTEG